MSDLPSRSVLSWRKVLLAAAGAFVAVAEALLPNKERNPTSSGRSPAPTEDETLIAERQVLLAVQRRKQIEAQLAKAVAVEKQASYRLCTLRLIALEATHAL